MQPDSSYITSLQLHQHTGTTFLHNQISDLTNYSFISRKKEKRDYSVDVWCPDADVRMMTPLLLLTHGTYDSELRWIQGRRELQLSFTELSFKKI